MRNSAEILLLLTLSVTLAGCIYVFRKGAVEQVDPATAASDTTRVTVPLKAYLMNGDIVIMELGGRFTETALVGRGQRYSPEAAGFSVDESAQAPHPLLQLPLDSLAAVETFSVKTQQDLSVGVSFLATVGAIVATPVLLVAIFGSCPTTYSHGDGPVLEAESFSNSIVPLFERRDIDRLGVKADADGQVQLEVRNEALETHYINHLELLAVTHAPEAFATTTSDGRLVLLRERTTPPVMTSRAGADVTAVLAAPDAQAYRTSGATLDGVTADDPLDHIDLALPHPGTDSVAVLLRLRNSLLSTVLFYEFMLGRQGAGALNWLGRDLSDFTTVVELGDFYQRRMGLRVAVRHAGTYREVGRVHEVGPIAWSEVAVPVAVPPGDSLHLRLSFIADAWRIDQVTVASYLQPATAERLPVEVVTDAQGEAHGETLQRLAGADEEYLVTYPGDRYTLTFTAPSRPHDQAQTFFLAAQGYYTEWVRGAWIREAQQRGTHPFRATDSTLVAVIDRWRAVQDDYEARFENTKIPVR